MCNETHFVYFDPKCILRRGTRATPQGPDTVVHKAISGRFLAPVWNDGLGGGMFHAVLIGTETGLRTTKSHHAKLFYKKCDQTATCNFLFRGAFRYHIDRQIQQQHHYVTTRGSSITIDNECPSKITLIPLAVIATKIPHNIHM